jgi:hypothetical protein
MKRIALLLMLVFTTISFAQQLRYKSGSIYDSNLNKLNGKEMRELLATKPGLLNFYNAGQSKKNVGGFMLGFGSGLMIGDLLLSLTSTSEYPSAITYVGATIALVSIPIISGYKKKLKTVVDDYNKQIVSNDPFIDIDQVSLIATQNGAGLRITF